jgi:hypothetical protein
MSINFQEILKELEYRVEHGIIDLNKEEQVTTLAEILKENGIPDANQMAQKARVYFSYINEASLDEKLPSMSAKPKKNPSNGGAAAGQKQPTAKPQSSDSLASKEAHKLGLVSKGYGRWAKTKDGQVTYMTDKETGKLVPVGVADEPVAGKTGGAGKAGDKKDAGVGVAGGAAEKPKPNISTTDFKSGAEKRAARANQIDKHDAGLSAASEYFKDKKYKNSNGDEVSFDTAINYNEPQDKAHEAAMDDFEAFLNANQGQYGTLEKPQQPTGDTTSNTTTDDKTSIIDKSVRNSIKEFENFLSDAQKLAIKLEEKKRIVELRKLDTLSQSFNKLPPESRNRASELFAKGQLFEGRENSGIGKNRLGYLDVKTLNDNKNYLLKAYGDGSAETIKKFVRNARRIKVSEEYVESSFNLLPDSLQSSLMGKGKVGDAGKDKHFLGYVRMDGTTTSDQNDKNIKKDRNGNPEIKRGNPGNRDRGKFVWRCILEQGGQDPYTGLPLDLSSIDLEHVRAFDNKDTGTPTAKDYLNREHDNNIVICATNVNQKKSNLSMKKFIEMNVIPQVGKSQSDFKKETETYETINEVASQTEQKAGLAVKDGKLKSGYNFKNLKQMFDNDDLVYNKAKDEFKKVAETNEDKKAIAGLNSEIGKATLMAIGLGRGIIDKSGRRTIKLSSDNLYRGFLLSMAEHPDKQDKFKAGWEAARKIANSDKFRLKGRGQQGMLKYLIDNKFISKSVLNDPKLGRVFQNALNEVYDYDNNIYILID